jgi:hypothetical protein
MRDDEDVIDLEVIISSKSCGLKNAYFYVEISDGAPISFQCMANFRGPIVRVVEPIADFGLVKVNTTQKFRITLENLSSIPS